MPSTPKKDLEASKKATPKSKTPRAKKGVARKNAEFDEAEDGDDVLKSPSAGRKRASESEEGGEGKKVKAERLGGAEFQAMMCALGK